MKILYTGEVADDATTAVYWEFALTMAEISPVFGTRRYFPLGNLNEPLTLKLTPNANAFQSVGDQYYGFRIKTVYYDQP